MEFNVNHPILFVVVGLIVALVLGQSIFFLVKALKRAKEINMDKAKVKKTITSSITFTIAPAISILVGVISLSVALGVPLPWLRLSVVGSLSYETVAAGSTIEALGSEMGIQITDPSSYVTVAWVMTLGIIVGLFLVPLLTKKIQSGMISLENKDKKWMEIFNSAMFLGMISAFLGMVFGSIGNGITGLIPIFVLLVSALTMALCGILIKKCNMKWLETYAMAISMVVAMIFAVVITPVLS